jgi:hypothetical protein
MRKSILVMGLLVLAAMMFVPPAHANVSGAIFTTVADGTEVNFNIYQFKTDVYLDGGPGPGAPIGAAGLPDGDYVFMVTDPSGKTILSTDIAACRRFTVTGGIITALVNSGPVCSATAATPPLHVTGISVDHGSTTVQLMPYNDTPNHGNEYKVWVTPVLDYLCPFTVVDCNSGKHGFVDANSKTDNFKVKSSSVREIDTRFLDSNGNFIDDLGITWIDTLGASNNKWSYYSLPLDIIHEAHVEAPEDGTHQIVVQNQPGCTVGAVYLNGSLLPTSGPQTVLVKVSPSYKNITLRVDISCQ